MINLTILKVSVAHLSQIQILGKQTYRETFAAHNKEEDMRAYLDKAFSIEQLQKELTDANSQWYLAFDETKEAGYLKVNFRNAQTELKDDNAMEIERIYVQQAFQGHNIGKALLAKAIEIARENQVDYIWLGVWENNTKAQEFYKRNGFAPFGKHSFFMGDDEQRDLLMKLIL